MQTTLTFMSPHYSETGPPSVREGNRQHTYSCLLFEWPPHNEANQKRLAPNEDLNVLIASGATGMIVVSVSWKYSHSGFM